LTFSYAWNCVAEGGCWVYYGVIEAALYTADGVLDAAEEVANSAYWAYVYALNAAEAAVDAAENVLSAVQYLIEEINIFFFYQKIS
jgi:hypothetical protein